MLNTDVGAAAEPDPPDVAELLARDPVDPDEELRRFFGVNEV